MKTDIKSKNPKLITDWTPVPVGIVLAILGICFIAFDSIIKYLALAVGIFVIIGATVLATVTLLGKRSGAVFVMKIIFSVCALATGIITIIYKDSTASIVCMVFTGAVTVDGSIKLGSAISARRYTIAGRTVAFILALATTVTALLMFRQIPSEITDENISGCALVIGVTFILDAFANIMMPFLKKGLNDRIVSDVVTQSESIAAEAELARAKAEEAAEAKAKANAEKKVKKAAKKNKSADSETTEAPTVTDGQKETPDAVEEGPAPREKQSDKTDSETKDADGKIGDDISPELDPLPKDQAAPEVLEADEDAERSAAPKKSSRKKK